MEAAGIRNSVAGGRTAAYPSSLASDASPIAAQLALQMRSEVVLRSDSLEAVGYILQRHCFDSPTGQLVINYDDFSQVAAECRELLGPHTDTYFQASTFLRLAKDEGGCVPLPALFAYLAARSRQLQLRLQLGRLDVAQSGSLDAEQLKRFLLELCPAGALQAAGVAPQDWVVVAAQRVWLGHARRSRLPIKDLCASPIMDDLLHTAQLLSGPREQAATSAATAQGWFAPANTLRLRSAFAGLDGDGDGLLGEADFARFSEGTMTSLFIERVFAQHCSGSRGLGSGGSGSSLGSGGGVSSGSGAGGSGDKAPAGRRQRGMDFQSFVTFVAAWEDRGHPGAVRYLFPVFDLRGRGYIDQVDLHSLFREVCRLWAELGQYAELHSEDLVVEALDLLRPALPGRVTAADFKRCGAAATVLGLLADANAMWEYENREALAQQAQQELGGGGEYGVPE